MTAEYSYSAKMKRHDFRRINWPTCVEAKLTKVLMWLLASASWFSSPNRCGSAVFAGYVTPLSGSVEYFGIIEP